MASLMQLLLGLICAAVTVRVVAGENATLCWDANLDSVSQVPGNRSFATVCSGVDYSCALEPSGKAWCWGDSFHGKLGNGADPLQKANSSTPVQVLGNHTFRSLACGWGHSCAVDETDQAWCWGFNTEGQLGSGDAVHSSVPRDVAGGYAFKSVCAGRSHSCGVTVEGIVLCWGSSGYLGAGPYANSSTVPVEALGNQTFASISCARYATCGLEPPPSSKAWCWGGGSFGQLGNGNDEAQESPTLVAGGHAFASISAGWSHTCAITLAGSLLCWGEPPGTGQDPSPRTLVFEPAIPPFLVESNNSWAAVSAADDGTCVLDSWGKIACFAYNGNPNMTDAPEDRTSGASSMKLVPIPGGHSFVYLGSAFDYRTCAISNKPGNNLSLYPAPPLPSGSVASSPLQLPASPTPATPAPLSPPVSATSGSSGSASIPVGAVAAGATAGAAAVAILAFLALRPRKGWLRRRHAQPALDGGKIGAATPDGLAAWGDPSGCGGQPAHVQPASAAPAAEVDTLLPCSVVVLDTLLPYSQAAIAGRDVAALGDATASSSSSGSAPASDAVLSFITSYLGTCHQIPSQHLPEGTVGTEGPNGTSRDVPAQLRSDARLWQVAWSELNMLRRVGRGSFGSVYLAEWSHTRVAVKVLVTKEDMNRGQMDLPERLLRDLQAEAAVMSRMRHPNILQFMGLVALPPALITEYCSRGSLYDCLKAAHEHPGAAAQLTWHLRLAMAVDAATGLCYLHRRGIIHRDVKSPNLLLDESWRVKVADFNLSKLLEGARPEASLSSTGATNPIWLAPEVMEGDAATAASDVYGFGMVLYELLTWRLPWNLANMTPFKVGAMVRQGRRPEVPPLEALPGSNSAGWAGLDTYVQLMRDCWAQRPEDRPSFDAVVGRLRQLLESTPPS